MRLLYATFRAASSIMLSGIPSIFNAAINLASLITWVAHTIFLRNNSRNPTYRLSIKIVSLFIKK